jgi:hypothetical protein
MNLNFNVNVWFNIIAFLIGWILVFWLPQRLPKVVSTLIMMMSLAVSLGLDHTIGVPPIDTYDTNIKPWLTLSEIPTWGMYPIFGYLFIYLYDKLKIRGMIIPFYILCWSLFGTAFEALADTFRVYHYKVWELRYSFLVYMFTQLLTVIVFNILMNTFTHKKESVGKMID